MFETAGPKVMHTIGIICGIDDEYRRSVAEDDMAYQRDVQKAARKRQRRRQRRRKNKVDRLYYLKTQLHWVTKRGVDGTYPADAAEKELLGMPLQDYLNGRNLRVDDNFRFVSALEYAIENPEATPEEIHKKFQPVSEHDKISYVR